MKLNELNNLNIWSVKRNQFISLQECDCTLDDMDFSDDYVFLRNYDRNDKNGVLVKEGDILRMNPDDDDWMDIVIYRPSGLNDNKYELELLRFKPDQGNVCLDLALDKDNPAVIEGNILTHPALACKVLSYRV